MRQKLDKLLRGHPFARFVADMVDAYFSKRVSRAAAELAYFLILTFFPSSSASPPSSTGSTWT